MPRLSSSKRTKAARTASAAAREDKEARLQQAINELQNGHHPNASAAAAAHGVPASSLRHRLKGRTPKKDAQNEQQALSPTAETTLVEHIRRSAANGFPLNPADVRNYANSLARGVPGRSEPLEVGITWVQRFLQRHPSLKSSWSRCLENARVKGTDREVIEEWFNRLAEIVREYRVTSDSIYNMDKTGFTFGQGGSQRVLVPDDDPASRFKAQPDTRENATVIECIGSGGQVLPPLVITRGKIHTVGEQRQMEGIPADWHFAKTPTGWTNIDVALQWANDVFDAHSKPSSRSQWRLLILDGHRSHVSSDFLAALWSQRIIPFCLPPHATHVMQPLDVSIFAPLKAAYKRSVTELASHVPGAGIDKPAFGTLYAKARGATVTSAAAKKAFKDSGITVNPKPDKVLARLPGSHAGRRSGSTEHTPLQEVAVPQSNTDFNSMLDAFRNAKDEREARVLKRALNSAYQAPQAKQTVAETQETRRAVVAAQTAKPRRIGDRAVLSRDTMIS